MSTDNNKIHYEEVKSECRCRNIHSQPAIQSSEFKNDIRSKIIYLIDFFLIFLKLHFKSYVNLAQKSLCKYKHQIPPNDEDEKSTIDKLQEEASNIKRPTSLLSCTYFRIFSFFPDIFFHYWNIISGTRSQATSIRNKKGRCDPVELYHYYSSFWKNHKLPGENDHAQLRLAIRKRLMNGNPNRI